MPDYRRAGSHPYRAKPPAGSWLREMVQLHTGQISLSVRSTSASSACPPPPKLAFEHVHRKMDHCRPAVRTGARRIAGFEIVQQRTLLFIGQCLPGLDSHAFADARREVSLRSHSAEAISSSSKSSTRARNAADGSLPMNSAGIART